MLFCSFFVLWFGVYIPSFLLWLPMVYIFFLLLWFLGDCLLSLFVFFRRSLPEVFYKKGALRKFIKFTRKHLCQSPFFNKVAGLRPATLLKKRLCHSCFPVSFVKFLRTPFLQNTSGRPLLIVAILF